MHADELDERLQALGFPVKRGTLRRWAADGVIAGPQRYFREKADGQGRRAGRMADWPEATVEDTVAYLRLKERHKNEPVQKSWIPQLRAQAASWYETPFWCTGYSGMAYSKELQDFLKQAGVHCFIIDFTFGLLIDNWLPTIEKVRHSRPIDKPAKVVYVWDIPREGYKAAMTLEEAQQLNLPAMRPSVEMYDAVEEDVFEWIGKIQISEDEESRRLANRSLDAKRPA